MDVVSNEQLEELIELWNVPEIRQSISVELSEVKRIYREEMEAYYKMKFKKLIGDIPNYKHFTMKKMGQTDTPNRWRVVAEDCKDEEHVFTSQFVDYLASHPIDMEKSVNVSFINVNYSIEAIFVRYKIDLIMGKIKWTPKTSSNGVKVVENFNWKLLPKDNQIKLFLDTFESHKKIQDEILEHFFAISLPYLGQKII